MATDPEACRLTSRWRRLAFPVLALAGVLLLFSALSEVLNPVLVAVLLAVLLNPVVNAAARFGLPRVLTVSLLYVLLLLGLTLAGSIVLRQFTELGRALAGEPFHADFDDDGLIEALSADGRPEFEDLDRDGEHDPGALLRLEGFVNRTMSRNATGPWGETLDEVRAQLVGMLGSLARPAGDMIARGIDGVATWAGGLIALLTMLVLVPFYLFFFLVEYPAMTAKVRSLVPARYRDQVDRITRDIGRELVAFFRGRLMCGFIKAVMLYIGLLVLGIDFALPIALACGVLSLVPFVGFIVGVVPASVIALTMPDGGTETLLWVVGLFSLAEAFEGAVLFPLVLGRETGLHAVTIVVVLLAGGAIFGTLGVLIGIPLALISKVLWRELGLPLYRDWANPPPAVTS
ncbi:MAG: AI-2E family transporter [Planctomycetes bacterium]|nr:AI-2E family transporter [Planctomycetota bacterium]